MAGGVRAVQGAVEAAVEGAVAVAVVAVVVAVMMEAVTSVLATVSAAAGGVTSNGGDHTSPAALVKSHASPNASLLHASSDESALTGR